MLKELTDRFINKPRVKKEAERKEKVDTFFNFMRSPGVDVDKLQPEYVASWFRYLNKINLNPEGTSLTMVFSFHHSFLWQDARIDFSISAENANKKVLTAQINQSMQINPQYVGDVDLFLSGEIKGISLAKSAYIPKKHPLITFENNEGLGFSLIPFSGGIISNFKGYR